MELEQDPWAVLTGRDADESGKGAEVRIVKLDVKKRRRSIGLSTI